MPENRLCPNGSSRFDDKLGFLFFFGFFRGVEVTGGRLNWGNPLVALLFAHTVFLRKLPLLISNKLSIA